MNTDGNTNLPAPTTALKPWTKNGPSPNPRGRGHSPNAFSKAFLKSVSAKWMEHGDDVLTEVRRDDPGLFLRICASLIPREVNIHTTETRPMTQLSQAELEGIIFEDISKLEHVRMAMEPLVSRVDEFDAVLADDMRKVLDV
jgi:hypothetical protein